MIKITAWPKFLQRAVVWCETAESANVYPLGAAGQKVFPSRCGRFSTVIKKHISQYAGYMVSGHAMWQLKW